MAKKQMLEMWPVDAVKPYENNPRKNDAAVAAVAASIQDFGFRQPIIVDSDGVIIAGHTRLKAAKQLKLEQVPVLVAADLTSNQARALRLADNKTTELSVWDKPLLDLELEALSLVGVTLGDYGFPNIVLPDTEEELEKASDVVPDPRCQVGDLWLLGAHRLIVGDSTDPNVIFRLLDGTDPIDLLITDPPYGVAYVGKTDDALTIENDSIDNLALERLIRATFTNISQYMRAGAAYYVWHASVTASIFNSVLTDTLGVVRQQLIWVKNAMVLGRSDYQWQHEPCFYGWKPGAAHYFTHDRTQTTVFEVPKPRINADHPTMKPIELIRLQVANSSRRGERVLDPFAGSGATLLACEAADRVCYSAELSPRYGDVVLARWEAATGGKAVKS
jgi:site-specific DNA-methyltransferase (adenine-specific)